MEFSETKRVLRMQWSTFDRLETCISEHTLVRAFYELRRASMQGEA